MQASVPAPNFLPVITPAESSPRLRALAESWKNVDANERASFQTWFLQFCDALGVPAPLTPTDDYRFELPVKVVDREGELATNFIDAWHAAHFAMEAKMSDPAVRNNDALLRKAFGQVRNYVSHVSGTPPPYLMVVDVPRTLMIWDRWSGSYGDFGAGRRIALGSLQERADDIALLQDVFARPQTRDPRGKAQLVTKEIASRLARLAAALEDRGLDQERVARFLMRCVFSCFAEDVGLLPEQLFRKTLEAARASGNAEHLKAALELLWKTMDEGGMFGAEMLHRFNGHFFKTREALPLESGDVTLLIEATSYDWSRVEPSIFGTLLVRALDPEERHRLGAEYTPREYIERLVEPTVVEPIREKWVAVQATVVQLEESGKKKEKEQAVKVLLDFHSWMRGLRFLDPACGSGNFLYVTMAAVKRIEFEVLNEIQRVSGGQGGLVLDEVHPRQFHGIEIKPWAREIAELTLWIGYHQFWRETHGGRTPPDPILEDTGTIECRDAILAYDAVVHRPEKDRADPTPRILSPVTGELVPDPAARLPYYEYVNARKAEWPEAEFIVGNPPYLGQGRQREALSDGYVDALRGAYPLVPDSADLVMFWWYRAAHCVLRRNCLRAGLITTNSIVQRLNRVVVEDALRDGLAIVWAAADHPWFAHADAAAVRVSMTVLALTASKRELLSVSRDGAHALRTAVGAIHADLTAGANLVAAASQDLRANSGLAHDGVKLHGRGFVLTSDECERLRPSISDSLALVRPLLNGRDLTTRPRGVFAIDFALMEEVEAAKHVVLFNLVADRVKPSRLSNRREIYRQYWWRFGEPRREFRVASRELKRFIGTPDTSAHRFFRFLTPDALADDSVVQVASDSAFVLGVLSSRLHITWADAVGGRLGVGNDQRWNKTSCFDPFPFPSAAPELHSRIGEAAARLDSHRKAALSRDERITMTRMYNIVEKLRSGEALTPAERTINELAACGILRDLHDELDKLVAEAYGWPWPMEREEILERLVALHDDRVEEEKRGLIRWIRPDYQIPRFAPEQAPASLDLDESHAPKSKRGRKAAAADEPPPATTALPAWPDSAIGQIGAISALLTQRPMTAAEVSGAFAGARKELVARHLETLALMGEIVLGADGRFRGARVAA